MRIQHPLKIRFANIGKLSSESHPSAKFDDSPPNDDDDVAGSSDDPPKSAKVRLLDKSFLQNQVPVLYFAQQ